MNVNDDINKLLIFVCVCGFLGVVKELIKVGVEVNLCNILNEIFLIVICVFGYVYVFEELIKVGVDFNLCNGFDEILLIVVF